MVGAVAIVALTLTGCEHAPRPTGGVAGHVDQEGSVATPRMDGSPPLAIQAQPEQLPPAPPAPPAPPQPAEPSAASEPSDAGPTDRAVIRSLADALAGRTPAPERIPLAIAWMGSPSAALRSAGLEQLERMVREGGRLADAELDAVQARLADADAANRAAAVRLLANSTREAESAGLVALLSTESHPEVRAELLRLKWLEEREDALVLARAGLAEAPTREAAAALALRLLARQSVLGTPLPDEVRRECLGAASDAWRAAPSAALASLLAALGREEAPAGHDAVAALLSEALQESDGKVRRAAAVALLELGEGARLEALESTDGEIRRALLEHAIRTARTTEAFAGLVQRFRPAAGAGEAEVAAYRAAVLAALDGLAPHEFLLAEASAESAVSAADRADVASRRLSEVQSAVPPSDAERREVIAALAVRTAELLIRADRFTEASIALSGDVGMADPESIDALRIAAGLAQGGGAALPARPADETPEQEAAAMARAHAALARLNPAAAEGLRPKAGQ